METTTTPFDWLLRLVTIEKEANPLSYYATLLLLVFLDRSIAFLLFCIASIFGACFSGGSRSSSSSSSSSGSEVITVNAGDDDLGDQVLLERGEVEMVMEKMGFRCDPDEEMGCGHGQIAELFGEEPDIGEVREAFQVFDENADGYIDAGELKKVLRSLGFAMATEEECQKMIQAFDDNGDGRIDFDEFTKLLENSFSS